MVDLPTWVILFTHAVDTTAPQACSSHCHDVCRVLVSLQPGMHPNKSLVLIAARQDMMHGTVLERAFLTVTATAAVITPLASHC